jgi:hypothetical protein
LLNVHSARRAADARLAGVRDLVAAPPDQLYRRGAQADLAVLLNLSDDQVTFALSQQAGSSAAGARGGTVTHLLGSDTAAPAGCVSPHGWAILELEP